MSDKKIKVPDGMLKAAWDTLRVGCPQPKTTDDQMEIALEAALHWLSEHPIAPTEEQIIKEAPATSELDARMHVLWIGWWIPRMFLAPGPEAPENIKNLLIDETIENGYIKPSVVNQRIIDAERRGFQRGRDYESKANAT